MSVLKDIFHNKSVLYTCKDAQTNDRHHDVKVVVNNAVTTCSFDVAVSGFFNMKHGIISKHCVVISAIPYEYRKGHGRILIEEGQSFFPNSLLFVPHAQDYSMWCSGLHYDKKHVDGQWITSGLSGLLQILFYGKPKQVFVEGMYFYERGRTNYDKKHHDMSWEKTVVKTLLDKERIVVDTIMKDMLMTHVMPVNRGVLDAIKH